MGITIGVSMEAALANPQVSELARLTRPRIWACLPVGTTGTDKTAASLARTVEDACPHRRGDFRDEVDVLLLRAVLLLARHDSSWLPPSVL